MGATSDVWARFESLLARQWPGRWAAPDLPGHGGSSPLREYSFHEVAAAVARGLPALQECRDVVVVGHSLGGVIGLALASGAVDVPVRLVVGLGIKTQWTDADLDRARELAQRPPTYFATREDAGARYLRVSGLAGLVPPHDPAVAAGLRGEDGRWRLAMDPAAFAIGAPDMTGLLAEAKARVVLARGENDAMVSDEDLARFGMPVVTLPGAGHNAHVESPALVLRLSIDGGQPGTSI
jgi:pimeloyl-ACP methyl ester carboxylesterase